jgi:microfibrillar-associated protein 1
MSGRAAQGERKAQAQSLVGSRKDGSVSEKVVEVVSVRRYWPGKAPQWSQGNAGEAEEEGAPHSASIKAPAPTQSAAEPSDRRLQRLAQGGNGGGGSGGGRRRRDSEDDSSDASSDDSGRPRKRRGEAAVIKEAAGSGRGGAVLLERGGGGGRRPGQQADSDSEEEEDDDAIEARRERLRALQRRRRQEEEEEEEEEEAAARATARATGARGDESDEEGGDESDESSEYETDDDEEDGDAGPGSRPMLKPIFTSAEARVTQREREEEEAAVEERQQRQERKAAAHKEESRALLVEAVRQDELGGGDGDQNAERGDMPDDNDEVDELEEFDAWKVRELKRVRRERQERDAAEAERRELQRRRDLTDAERAREDEEFRKQRLDHGKEKEKWAYLQKYYHKGAFFQDEDETGNSKLGPVMMQDFGAPTGKDRIGDKSSMPAPMQVKNFGMRSQVKWTHLSAEDTLGGKGKDAEGADPLWGRDRALAAKFERKQAGQKGAYDFGRPSANKRRKG